MDAFAVDYLDDVLAKRHASDLAATAYLHASRLDWCPICIGYGFIAGLGPCVAARERGHGRPMLKELWAQPTQGENDHA